MVKRQLILDPRPDPVPQWPAQQLTSSSTRQRDVFARLRRRWRRTRNAGRPWIRPFTVSPTRNRRATTSSPHRRPSFVPQLHRFGSTPTRVTPMRTGVGRTTQRTGSTSRRWRPTTPRGRGIATRLRARPVPTSPSCSLRRLSRRSNLSVRRTAIHLRFVETTAFNVIAMLMLNGFA